MENDSSLALHVLRARTLKGRWVQELRTKSQPVKMGTEPQVKVYVTCMSVCTHVHIDNGRETVQLLNCPIFKDSRKDFLSSFSTIFQF